jgi:hypothetical protein
MLANDPPPLRERGGDDFLALMLDIAEFDDVAAIGGVINQCRAWHGKSGRGKTVGRGSVAVGH